jgi:hypothetical protein
LADLLQRLIVLAALVAGAAAQSKPFSHRAHLKLGLECLGCHASAAQSERVEDNNLPSPRVCAGCHEKADIGAPSPTPLTKFSHQRHLKMGNFGKLIAAAIDSKTYLSPPGDIRRHLSTANPCAACHRALEESDAVGKANMPQMADCIVCHNQIDPPFSCEQCHARGPRLRPASHTREFGDEHSTGKLKLDKPSCVICHGRQFRCMGCH